jgi:hypothetical protein
MSDGPIGLAGLERFQRTNTSVQAIEHRIELHAWRVGWPYAISGQAQRRTTFITNQRAEADRQLTRTHQRIASTGRTSPVNHCTGRFIELGL